MGFGRVECWTPCSARIEKPEATNYSPIVLEQSTEACQVGESVPGFQLDIKQVIRSWSASSSLELVLKGGQNCARS